MNWDLTSYFPSFDGPELAAFQRALADDLQSLLARAEALPTLGAGNADAWESVLLDVEELSRRLSHLGSYLGCLTAADAADEAYRKAEAGFARTAAEAEKLEVELQRGLKEATDGYLEGLAARPALADCGFHLRRLREEARRTMSTGEERLSADLGVDGIHAWGRLYDTLSGKLEFDMRWPDGRRERLPMAQRRSLMSHPARPVRRAAFEGGNASWEAVQDVTAAALNAIAGTRLTLNRHRGVDHFLDTALFQARITRRSLEALFEAIYDRAELARRVFRFRAQAMGAQGIAWYDLEAPLPAAGEEKSLSWSEARGWVEDAFAAAYPALGEFTRQMSDHRWIEWEPRPGKRPGAFCTGSLLTMEPRVYMTFNGRLGDVRTLAHEAGHAFHHHVLREARPVLHHYPMTLAESASTFGEMILTEGVLADPAVSDEDKLRVLDMETAHGAVYLLDIPVRFEFEKAFHEERLEEEVEVSRLCELMSQTQRRLLGDALEEGGEDPLFWASKLHFYITGLTFYNFPYTFGFLLSRGLFARFREDGAAFLPRYEEFLRRAGAETAENVARESIGADLESRRFWLEAIDTLKEPIERLEKLWSRQARQARRPG